MSSRSKSNPWFRRLAWLALVLGALGAGATYVSLHPEELPDWAKRTQLGRELQKTTVYKWQDATGAWHITDRPPPNGVGFETESYARDANVLPLPPELQR